MLVILGREAEEEEADQSLTEQASSFVAGVMASMMAVAARRELGAAAPILMVETGDELSDSRVRAGFELDSLIPDFMSDVVRGLYVEGIFAGSEDDEDKGVVKSGVLLELYLPHDLVGAGQYGPGETWSVDLAWEP